MSINVKNHENGTFRPFGALKHETSKELQEAQLRDHIPLSELRKDTAALTRIWQFNLSLIAKEPSAKKA